MSDKFKIVDMKLAHGNWKVKFAGPQSWIGYSPPEVTVLAENEQGEAVEMNEAAAIAHQELAQRIFDLLKVAVISIPDRNWDQIVRTVIWPQLHDAVRLDQNPDDA